MNLEAGFYLPLSFQDGSCRIAQEVAICGGSGVLSDMLHNSAQLHWQMLPPSMLSAGGHIKVNRLEITTVYSATYYSLKCMHPLEKEVP